MFVLIQFNNETIFEGISKLLSSIVETPFKNISKYAAL